MLNQGDFIHENFDELKRKHRLYSDKTFSFQNFCMNEYISYIGILEENYSLKTIRGIYKDRTIPDMISELNFAVNRLKDKRQRELLKDAMELLNRIDKIGKHEQQHIRD